MNNITNDELQEVSGGDFIKNVIFGASTGASIGSIGGAPGAGIGALVGANVVIYSYGVAAAVDTVEKGYNSVWKFVGNSLSFGR